MLIFFYFIEGYVLKIVFSVLNFPSIVNLNHHESSSTSSTSTFSSSVPQSSTINSHSSEDKRFKHFTLKIHDVDNNDRHELKVYL